MDNLDSVSEANLLGVAPALREMTLKAVAELAHSSVWVRVVSGLRSGEQQDILYAQGRFAPGKIVTNARAGQSMHNYGLAIDVVPFLIGQSGRLNWRSETEQFQEMVAAFQAAGLAWGGDWPGRLGDYDHFQMPRLRPTPTAAMMADYGVGSAAELSTIWGKVASGAYVA